MQIGKTVFNLEGLRDWSKKQFIETYKGKLEHDIDVAWEMLQTEIKHRAKALKPVANKAEKTAIAKK